MALAAIAGAQNADSTKVDTIVVEDSILISFSRNRMGLRFPREIIGKITRDGDTIYVDEMEVIPYIYVDTKPKIINPTISYPDIGGSRPKCVVIVEFVIDTIGDVLPNSARVIRARPEGACEDEAVDSIYKYKFTPGKQGNRKVKVRMQQPLRFKLEDAEQNKESDAPKQNPDDK